MRRVGRRVIALLPLLTLVGSAATASPLAGGYAHTCAVTGEGGLKCWGRNWGDGALGDGTKMDRLTPVDVSGLSSGVVATAVGLAHSCALITGGGVKCWGWNSSGQLGDGTTTNSLVPVDVLGLTSGVSAISVGTTHSCALTNAGAVKCWGDNTRGKLGDGSLIERHVPTDVVGLAGGVKAIAAGGTHTCALTNGGAVRCWGQNDRGQVGDGTKTNRSTPVDVAGLTGDVVAITAGTIHTCALTAAGGAKCWGNNSIRGQLGDGTTTDRLTPVDVIGLTIELISIAAGDGHTCALTSTFEALCWGDNTDGQLGDGTTTNRLSPVRVQQLPPVDAIATGLSHSCARTRAGSVECWGLNGFAGILGNGLTDRKLSPVPVMHLGSDVRSLSLGRYHSCAITSSGAARCWGHNAWGKLGEGTMMDRFMPTDVSGLGSGLSMVASSDNHTCALSDAGSVTCWGANYSGQLGDGTSTPRLLPGSIAIATAARAVSAGQDHTCGMTDAGGVLCWGVNRDGQLGDGTRTTRHSPVDVFGLSSGVAAVVAGSEHSCALTTAGGAKCWGAGVGDGSTETRLTPVDVTGLEAGIAAVVAGGFHGCALTNLGSVKCWGYNGSGQLGDGTRNYRTSPVDVIGPQSDVIAITAGRSHSCALLRDGSVKCWGANGEGQLGDGTTDFPSVPVDVMGLQDEVVAIEAGGFHTCAVTRSAVECWGWNFFGQLGNGEGGYSVLPVDVLDLGPICGDGTVDPGEACDDGNSADDDCCSSTCELITAAPDADADGICNDADNCPFTYNPDQRDSDASAGGDLCDACPSDAADRCAAAKTAAGTIDEAGAMLEVPDQSLTLDFPPGALSGPTSVSATGGLPGNGYGLKLLPDKSPLAFELQPSGQTFDPPVGVTFRWQDANDNCFVDNPATSCPVESRDACAASRNPSCDLPVRESDLKIFRNGSAFPLVGATCASDPWRPSAMTGCDPEANSWTIEVSEFSEYVLGQCAAAKQRRLTLDGLEKPRGDETLRLRGRMDVETPADPAIDPLTTGFALVVERARPKKTGTPKKVKKRTLYTVQVPGGAYDEATGTGWKKKPNRDLWTYTSTTAKGVSKASVLWTGMRVKFDVTATGLKLRKLKKKDLPLVARFVLDGRCGDASFAGPAPAPLCAFSDGREEVSCR